MILTVCTRPHYAAALTLGQSVATHHPDQRFVIGLADDPADVPASANQIGLADTGLTAAELAALSARYSPTEFRAALKSSFIRAAFEHYSNENELLYLDPTAFVYQPLTTVFDQINQHSILLNPHWLAPPADALEPDEKHMQNVGLYSSGLIGFRRHPETMRMLDWWSARSLAYAAVDFCEGSCLDQLWLMHVPTLFREVSILKHPGVQVALWNLPQRPLTATPTGWQIGSSAGDVPLMTADFLGLTNRHQGLFQQQNRLRLGNRPDVCQLLAAYQNVLASVNQPTLTARYGQQSEAVVQTGWRRTALKRLDQLSHWISNVPVPPLHR